MEFLLDLLPWQKQIEVQAVPWCQWKAPMPQARRR